jgi:hypothetical protein
MEWRKNTIMMVAGLWLLSSVGVAPAVAAQRLRPTWPAPQSRCQRDAECDVNLVCAPLDGETLSKYKNKIWARIWSRHLGENVCQPGCRIDSVFYPDGMRNPANDCQSCQSSTDRRGWINLASGATCGSVSGDCDAQDTCDGLGVCVDNIQPATAPCKGTSNGSACDDDKQDHCSGTDKTCVDVFLPSTEVCRGAAGPCDVAENCTGTSGSCPTDSFAASGTLCAGTSNGSACDDDKQDHCSGTDNTCVDAFLPSAEVCRAAAGQCDVADHCSGTSGACPPDAKSTDVCRAADPAFPCDTPEVCDGSSNECPSATTVLCKENGTDCTGDGQCSSGSCNGGVCEPVANVGASCDSNPDCPQGYVCEGGTCLGAFGSLCTQSDQCGSQLACDATGSGQCRTAPGQSCGSNSDCAENATCQNGICRLNLNATCQTDGECGSGYCACVIQDVPVCLGQSCPSSGQCRASTVNGPAGQTSVVTGLCKIPYGESCTENSDCAAAYRQDEVLTQGYTKVADGRCANGVCAPGLLVIGTICEFDPPGRGVHCSVDTTGGNGPFGMCTSDLDCPGGHCVVGPQIGESPYDATCGSGRCFKAAGTQSQEIGPCTPMAVCDGSTTGGLAGQPCPLSGCPDGTCLNSCGGPVNPPDYKCCRDDGGVCSTDSVCCGRFLDRMRGCKSPDFNETRRCGPLSIAGESCTTTADCLRRGELICNNPSGRPDAGTCVVPTVTPVLSRGAECDPANPNGYCDTGLTCFNCQPEGRGYRCADASHPCCNNGGVDEFFCGSTSIDQAGVDWTNSCCDFTCYHPDDNQHCGGCGTDCTDNANVCYLTGTGICALQGDSFGCEQPPGTETPGLCPEGQVCTPTDNPIPGGYECVVPITDQVDWQQLCLGSPDGVECSSNSQCTFCDENCTCPFGTSADTTSFGVTRNCDCG